MSISRLTNPRTHTPCGMAGRFTGAILPGVARQRPAHVLAHELRRMLRVRSQRGHDPRGRGRIAERHRDVAQPPLVTDAPDRRALEAALEFLLGPCEEPGERGRVQSVAHREGRIVGALRVLVPGAYHRAIVAAVDAVAHERTQL